MMNNDIQLFTTEDNVNRYVDELEAVYNEVSDQRAQQKLCFAIGDIYIDKLRNRKRQKAFLITHRDKRGRIAAFIDGTYYPVLDVSNEGKIAQRWYYYY